MTSMLVFLEINGAKFFASDHDLVEKMVKIAENNISLEDFTRWVKFHVN